MFDVESKLLLAEVNITCFFSDVDFYADVVVIGALILLMLFLVADAGIVSHVVGVAVVVCCVDNTSIVLDADVAVGCC